ncbi:MAG: DUF6882 domain-containing protein [Terriglobales bacterium]
MTTEEFSQFRHEAIHALKRLNEANEKEFRIGSWSRYDYDLDRGTLTFSQEGLAKVVASILVVGTTSQSAGNWLWSWANGNLPDTISEPVKNVRDFGTAENVAELVEPYLPDDEYVGWAMTAIAAKILDAKGAYRCPGTNGYIYMLLTDIAFADLPSVSAKKNRISCGTHGIANETYVCEHLIRNPNQQWFSGKPNQENPWPDAWCGVCDAFFQTQGEWNEKNEKNLRIKILCHFCYEAFRARSLTPS